MPKRIALFTTYMPVGGVPRMLVNISKGMCDKGYEVDLILCHKKGAFLEQVDPRVKIVELRTSNPFVVIYQLRHYFKTKQPDSFMGTGLHRNIYSVISWLLAGKPSRLVLSERVLLSAYWTDRHPMWLQSTLKWGYIKLGKSLFKKASFIHAVSREVADDLIRRMQLPPQLLQVIYNPFINPLLLQQKEQPITIPWDRGSIKLILSVGRLHPQKDYATLITAFSHVIKVIPNARLLILAEGSERPQLEQLIHRLQLHEVVSIPGFTDNPYSYMSKCDVFVLSSQYEGLANVLVEALACGAPVVSTNCPGGTQEILEDGRYGTVVPVGDPGAMAEAICAAIVNSVEALHRTQEFLNNKGSLFTLQSSLNGYHQLLTGETA